MKHQLPNPSFTVQQVLTALAQTPLCIATLTANIAPARLHASPGSEEWSARDVLAHLRSCADVWGGCMMAMIAQDRQTIRAISPRTWIRQTDYLGLDFQRSLLAFATQRTDLLAVLELLAPDGWSRVATVTGAGKVIERTVLFYAHWLADHERPHLKQIERIVTAIHT